MKISYLFLMLGLLSFISCDDILEEDISNDIVQTTYPFEGAVIESNVVNFQWEELDGAKKYRVQVLDFDETVVLDSLVTKTSFLCPLSPGNYQWKVRGENFAYESNYSFSSTFSVVTLKSSTSGTK